MLIFAILGFDNLGKEILANGVFSAEMNQRHPETTSFISITCCDDLKEQRLLRRTSNDNWWNRRNLKLLSKCNNRMANALLSSSR